MSHEIYVYICIYIYIYIYINGLFNALFLFVINISSLWIHVWYIFPSPLGLTSLAAGNYDWPSANEVKPYVCVLLPAHIFSKRACVQLQKKIPWKKTIIARTTYTSIPSLESLVLISFPSHRLCHSDLDFGPSLSGLFSNVAGDLGVRRLCSMCGSPRVQLSCDSNNISRPVEMCPAAIEQSFTACLCFNYKGRYHRKCKHRNPYIYVYIYTQMKVYIQMHIRI